MIQVETTEDGIVSSNVYKSKETISAADGCTKTYEKLPLTGKNKDGEDVTYIYYVREKEDKDYDTSYMKNNGTETKISSDVAISSGSITIKNTEKMKFVLPETGGMGRNTMDSSQKISSKQSKITNHSS